MGLNIDPKKFQERIRNILEQAKPGRRKKKDTKARQRDQRETQENPKSERPRACQPFRVDLEAKKRPQEAPKSTQEEPKRIPKRSQDNIRIENLGFSEFDE